MRYSGTAAQLGSVGAILAADIAGLRAPLLRAGEIYKSVDAEGRTRVYSTEPIGSAAQKSAVTVQPPDS